MFGSRSASSNGGSLRSSTTPASYCPKRTRSPAGGQGAAACPPRALPWSWTAIATTPRAPPWGRNRRRNPEARLPDLLVVLEHVPDALGRVAHVVEVELVVLGEEAPLDLLEVAQHLPLRPDDLAEVDDLLLDVGDVAHDLLAGLLEEDVLLDPVELVAHLAEHREAVVDRVVDHLVEQVAEPLREH